jgi:hypothetical protein
MKKSAFGTTVSTLALVVSLGADGLSAQTTAPQEGARLDEIARVAAQQFIAARTDLEQTRPTVPLPAAGTPVSLTLDEATARALERNLELAVERLNPQTFDLNIARLEAAYRPTLTSQFGQRALVRPPTKVRPARPRPAADQPAEWRQHRPGRHDHV